jgi:hypothetical protein
MSAAQTGTEATMRTAQRKVVEAMSDRDLQELNTLMSRATWEAGLPTAAGVAEALATLPTARRTPLAAAAVGAR